MVTLAATPSDLPTTPKPSCGSPFHKGSLTVPCLSAQMPSSAGGPLAAGRRRKERRWHIRDPGTLPPPAILEHMVPGEADLELPIKSCLFPCFLGLHQSSCQVRDAHRMVVQVSPRCSCGQYTQRSLASLGLRKRPKSNCSQQVKLSKQWWRK